MVSAVSVPIHIERRASRRGDQTAAQRGGKCAPNKERHEQRGDQAQPDHLAQRANQVIQKIKHKQAFRTARPACNAMKDKDKTTHGS
jgi:hypothetical protein